MTGPRVDPPTLEGVLAQRANEAMQQGADPKAATDILGKMVAHLRANPEFAKQGEAALARGATPSDVAGIVWQHASTPAEPPTPPEGLASRVISGVGNAVGHALTHPVETAESLVTAPIKSAFNAVVAPGVGEARHDPRLSKGGNSGHMSLAEMHTPYDAEHGAITDKERLVAGAQTAANIAFPGIAGGVTKLAGGGMLAKVLGLAAAGAPAGAAYTPDDPAAGAITGGILAPLFGAATHGATKVAGEAASSMLDHAGRPLETRPLIQAGPLKIGKVEGLTDRAARLNASGLKRGGVDPSTMAPSDATAKPLAPVDLGGTPAQRMARGLKTSSPGAEAAIRADLEPRAGEAVQRVIDQGKELAGVQRANAYETHQQLKATTTAEGDAAYGKVWAKNGGGTIDSPEIAKLKETPAGAQAWKRAQKMMANDGITPSSGRPPDIPDAQWALLNAAAKARGIPLPSDGAMTLQEAHYWKLALDDLKQPGLNRGEGEGGIGYNEGRSIHGVQKRLLAVMDQANPDYATARKQFADNKSVENASTVAQDHWTRDPAESKAMLAEMTPGEQKVYRDQAFDKWAERIENGPEDVAKAQAKPLNQKRLRLLFPDDKSFAAFKQGLEQEAQMHATNKTVLTGSNTADKLSDMAHDAGVTLPDVMKILGGRPLAAARDIVGRGLRNARNSNTERLNVERAKLLTAGANGDAGARAKALQRMGGRPAVPASVPEAPPVQPAPKLLPAGRFEGTDEPQGPSIPMGGQVRTRGLLSGLVRPSAVEGEAQHGSAMPIRQPLPMQRRLPSGGPAAVPTEGSGQVGPGIPMRGTTLDQAVNTELLRRYRENPKQAVLLSRDQQEALAEHIRQQIINGQLPPRS